MGVVVQKYGGTSVGSIERIRAVAARVQRARQEGHQVVVVVSAMAGETDRLLRLAREVSATPLAREVDTLLATGEMVSIALVAMALHEVGCPAESFTGPQGGILTDNAHTQARIKHITTTRLQRALAAGVVPVVAGFQGISSGDDLTTLGRGGSDLTAVALAAALHADRCEIYTDVDGVYSADPNMVPAARRLVRISYDEMLEMARLGAKVLQARSVEFAKKYDVPVVVKSSFSEGSGTLVTRPEQDMEQVVVAGVTSDRNQAKITLTRVADRPGIAAKLVWPDCRGGHRGGHDYSECQRRGLDRYFVHRVTLGCPTGPCTGAPEPGGPGGGRGHLTDAHRQSLHCGGGHAEPCRGGGTHVRGAGGRND